MSETIDLVELLGVCVDLANRAGDYIRAVAAGGDLKAVAKDWGMWGGQLFRLSQNRAADRSPPFSSARDCLSLTSHRHYIANINLHCCSW